MNDLNLIFICLTNVLFEDKKSNEQLNYISNKAENFAYVSKVVYGVLENKLYLDYIIGKISTTRVNKIHKNVLIILEIGIYNIHFLNTKDYAIVNNLIELTKKKNKRSSGFVNAILRNYIRDERDLSKIYIKDDLKSLSIRYSTPVNIVKYIYDNYGMDYLKQFLRYINSEQKFVIRVNTLKTDRSSLSKALESEGYRNKVSTISKNALIIENPTDIFNLDEFKKGLFTIQQEASMKVVEVLDPKEETKILDLCAAPGTKTGYMGEYTKNNSSILANDVSTKKLDLIRENISRLSLLNIDLVSFDASVFKSDLLNKFDYILVDAPCSGLGVMGRKPEIRYNRDMNTIKNLSMLQRKILDNAIKYLKLGGYLVYSTCTIGKIENLDNFLYLKNKDQLENIKIEGKEYIEFSGFEEGTDGFFISKFRKKDYENNY